MTDPCASLCETLRFVRIAHADADPACRNLGEQLLHDQVTEERAVDLIHAMGTGTVLALLEKAPEEREGLAEAARDAVFATVIGNQSPSFTAGSRGAASALRACLDDIGVLSPGERQLLGELLQRIALAT